MPLTVFSCSRADFECILHLIERRKIEIERYARIAASEGRSYRCLVPLPTVAEVDIEVDADDVAGVEKATGSCQDVVFFSVDFAQSLERLISVYATVLLNRRKGSKSMHPRPPRHSIPVITRIGEAE